MTITQLPAATWVVAASVEAEMAEPVYGPGDVIDSFVLDGVRHDVLDQVGEGMLAGLRGDIEYLRYGLTRLASGSTSRVAEGVDASDAVDLLTRLTELESVIAAANARLSVVLDTHMRQSQARQGVREDKRGVGVAAQIGLARRVSPHRGARALGLAKMLTTELPETFDALAGVTSEYRASMVAKVTAVLDPDHRRDVDAAIGPALADLSDRAVIARATHLAYTLDPPGFTAAIGRGHEERYVSLRPAPMVMTQLSACLPVADGVACWASLDDAARTQRAGGDERTLAQLRADLLVERLTGRAAGELPDVELGLVMTDQALLGPLDTASSTADPTADATTGSTSDAVVDTAAHLVGYGPVPAPWARTLIRGATADPDAAQDQRVFLRRLFTAPDGTVQNVDTGRRFFSGALRAAIVYRDRYCRTPWCGAPISEGDHVVRDADGGATTWDNGQGLCTACNLAKEAPGFSASVEAHGPPGQRTHIVTTRTPTGHTYTSRPPPVDATRPVASEPRVERWTSAVGHHRSTGDPPDVDEL